MGPEGAGAGAGVGAGAGAGLVAAPAPGRLGQLQPRRVGRIHRALGQAAGGSVAPQAARASRARRSGSLPGLIPRRLQSCAPMAACSMRGIGRSSRGQWPCRRWRLLTCGRLVHAEAQRRRRDVTRAVKPRQTGLTAMRIASAPPFSSASLREQFQAHSLQTPLHHPLCGRSPSPFAPAVKTGRMGIKRRASPSPNPSPLKGRGLWRIRFVSRRPGPNAFANLSRS